MLLILHISVFIYLHLLVHIAPHTHQLTGLLLDGRLSLDVLDRGHVS